MAIPADVQAALDAKADKAAFDALVVRVTALDGGIAPPPPPPSTASAAVTISGYIATITVAPNLGATVVIKNSTNVTVYSGRNGVTGTLPVGPYTWIATASAGYVMSGPASGSFSITAPPPPQVYSLRYSTNADRSSSLALSGASITVPCYIFTTPDTNVTQVRFWFDNPGHTGTPRSSEVEAPFDFNGAVAQDQATPFTVPSGSHSVTAGVTVGGVEQFISSNFTGPTAPPPPPNPVTTTASVSVSGQVATVNVTPNNGCTVAIKNSANATVYTGGDGSTPTLPAGAYTWIATALTGFVMSGAASGSFSVTASPPPPPPPPGTTGYEQARAAGAPGGSATVTWSGGAASQDLTAKIVNVSANAFWGLLRPPSIKLRNVTITVAGSGYARTAWLAGGPVDLDLVKITRLTDGFKASSGMIIRRTWITDLAPSSFGEGHGDAIQFESSGSNALIEDCILEGLAAGGGNTNAAIQSEGGWDRVQVKRTLLRGGNFNMFIRTFNGVTPKRFVLTDCVFDTNSAQYGMLSVNGPVKVVTQDIDPNTLASGDTSIWCVRPRDVGGNALTASQLTASR